MGDTCPSGYTTLSDFIAQISAEYGITDEQWEAAREEIRALLAALPPIPETAADDIESLW